MATGAKNKSILGGRGELGDRLPRTTPPRTVQSSRGSVAGGAGWPLTLHGLDLVGDVEAAQRGQRTQEGGHVRGALEALRGRLDALPVVNLQVDDGPGVAGQSLGQGARAPAHSWHPPGRHAPQGWLWLLRRHPDGWAGREGAPRTPGGQPGEAESWVWTGTSLEVHSGPEGPPCPAPAGHAWSSHGHSSECSPASSGLLQSQGQPWPPSRKDGGVRSLVPRLRES